MSSELIPLAVSLLYGIPSFVLYVFILFQLVRLKYRKRFSNPFYGLCFAIGVVDCFGYIIYYAFFTLPMYSIASSIFSSSFFAPSALTSGIYFSLFFFGYLQLFGNCFLTMNRFTAIVFPLRHDRFWRVFFPLSIVITVATSLAPSWKIATAEALYVPLQSGSPHGGYAIMLTIPNPDFSFHLFLSIFITCGLCLFLNIISVILLILRQNVGTNRKVERNFFFAALIIFLIQGIHGIHEVLFFIGISSENFGMVAVMNSMLPWLMDIKFLSPPWILLCFSTAVRETVVKALPKQTHSNSTPVINITPTHT
ncbi:hypothetical protein QR680_007927 [Steinernema hermaphroditum]|uniref:Serpentine receptor class gamma n=1 Tax=Steinernema hermaphroditum TaxID=289476 RepID=A0AA39M6Q8_9BILA|nr:hypothetical protein QR680_007927 [Steinernema hermaphroditum]